MIAVVQRVSAAAVRVEGAIVGQIDLGLLALVSVTKDDRDGDVAWMARKLASLRIFRNADKHFDLDVTQVGGKILLVSNFTVVAATYRGRRPSFDYAADPQSGRAMFDALVQAIGATGTVVETGRFGADMKVELLNDGPATFILDSAGDRPRSGGTPLDTPPQIQT